MKRSLVPVVLLAAPLTAAAGGSVTDATCGVVVKIDDVATQTRGWADRLAEVIKAGGAKPAGACVVVDGGARAGVLRKDDGHFRFTGVEQDVAPASLKVGDGTVHLQFHGSDFNAA